MASFRVFLVGGLAALTAGAALGQSSAGSAAVVTPDAAAAPAAEATPVPFADKGELAFEQHRWQDAITEYRSILAQYPEDRLSLLRIAQAQRELKRYEEALATLETARTANAPEAMVDFERARDLAALHKRRRRARGARRGGSQRAARARAARARAGARRGCARTTATSASIAACARACSRARRSRLRSEFDFWVGHWEVRQPDGTLDRHEHHHEARRRLLDPGALGRRGRLLGHELELLSAEPRRVAPGLDRLRRHDDRHDGQAPVDGAMKMEGTLEYAEPNRVVAFRGAWTQGSGRARAPAARGVRRRRARPGSLVRRLLPASRLTGCVTI